MKMSQTSSAKYYSIKGFKEKLFKGINISLKERKTKSTNMVANNKKIDEKRRLVE